MKFQKKLANQKNNLIYAKTIRDVVLPNSLPHF
jgi:hypothetical protein